MAVFNKVKVGLIDMVLAMLNYSKICYIYNIYSSISRDINKKEGVIYKAYYCGTLGCP